MKRKGRKRGKAPPLEGDWTQQEARQEAQQEARRVAMQRAAYEDRESIQPGDELDMVCTSACEWMFEIGLGSGDALICPQPEDMDPVAQGEALRARCVRASVGINGHGRYVDYTVYFERTGHTAILNGPDAQALKRRAGS